MPSVDLGDLTASHATRLNWFRGGLGPRPDTRRRSRTVHSGKPPEGHLQARDLKYALSIRINLESSYTDGEVYARDDGAWYFSYHQENPDAAQRDREYINRGLLACIEDRGVSTKYTDL